MISALKEYFVKSGELALDRNTSSSALLERPPYV